MKLIFIYDSSELKEIGRLIDSVSTSDHLHLLTIDEKGKKKNLYNLAIDIKKKIPKIEPCIIFIHQYMYCADKGLEWLQRSSGIALIKFLRMVEVRQHIVLISPIDEWELIKQNPDNLVISSRGISVARYLHEFSNLTDAALTEIAKITFDVNLDIKPYIRAEFTLPEYERHNWANWWGIDRLWNVHRVIEKEKFGSGELWDLQAYPSKLKDRLTLLKNRQALFLYGYKKEAVTHNLEELHQERLNLERRLAVFLNVIDEIQRSVLEAKDTIHANTENTDTIKSEIFHNIDVLPESNGNAALIRTMQGENFERLISLFDKEAELRNYISELIVQKRQITNVLNRQKVDYCTLLESLNAEELRVVEKFKENLNSIEKIVTDLKSKISSVSIDTIRNEVLSRKPRILYIDDQADEGWSNIFQHIVYNGESKNLFEIIQPKSSDEINEQYFIDVVSPGITAHRPELILLDLRLKKETGIKINVDQLSGTTLLKEIRKKFSGIPVLMTTASNKSWSYEELQRIGCDAFWTKEGIDSGMTEKDSVMNYIKFAEIVNILTNTDHKFLYDCYAEIETLKEKGKTAKHWWEGKNRFNKEQLPEIDQELIFGIFNDTLSIYRFFLISNIMKQINSLVWNEWFYCSLIIQNLGKIIEKLHYGGAEVNTRTIEYRGDICGKQLFLKRHEASHVETVSTLSHEVAKDYIIAMLDYLNNRDNCSKPGLKIVGKIDLK